MVCKEDVLLWFKDLESYQRIDVMYDMLNMCIPFEVRFLGSCIEEIGKHSYQELRGPTIIANDVERLSKDPSLHLGLLDETSRHRAVIYMSVLSARNCSCANWFYRTLFRTERLEHFVNAFCNDDNILSELLLIFTLGLYHPAFTFEQKLYFGRVLEKLVTQEGNKLKMNYLPRLVCSARNISNMPQLDSPTISIKPSMMPGGDNTPIHVQNPPPGLPYPQNPMISMDFLPQNMLARTGFQPNIVVGAPEVHPFPPQPASPLVSQTASPPQSRAPSPHRTYNLRPLPPAPGLPTPPHIAAQPPPGHEHIMLPPNTQIQMDSSLLSNCQPTSLPIQFNSPDVSTMKINDVDDNKLIQDDKQHTSYVSRQTMYDSMKQQPNGRVLSAPYNKYHTAFITDQLHGLKLENSDSLHCSSSASSSSSINQSPPETPSVTPALTPHGPGRGNTTTATPQDNKQPRVNGMQQSQQQQQQQYINESTPPPPFNTTAAVPFSIGQMQHNTRYYTQTYNRPPFSSPYPYAPDLYSNFSSYPHIYFSMVPSLPPRNQNPNCFNCGGMGHSGVECNGHTVEDITQKPYTLEFDATPASDNPPPQSK